MGEIHIKIEGDENDIWMTRELVKDKVLEHNNAEIKMDVKPNCTEITITAPDSELSIIQKDLENNYLPPGQAMTSAELSQTRDNPA